MILLLNCSLRGEKSNSNYFLDLLEQTVGADCERMHLGTTKFANLSEKMQQAKTIVYAMPLYVDGVPAQVVEVMERLYDEKEIRLDNKNFYIISNLGFYESKQARIQVSIIKNWCEKMMLTYGGAFVVGAGEMLGSLRNVPMNQGPNKMMGEGMVRFANAIAEKQVVEDIYVEPTGFPSKLYQLAAHANWKRQIKANGLSVRALKLTR